MKFKQKTIFFSVIILLIVGSITSFMLNKNSGSTSNKYDTLATCLKDKGAVFYGAFWCSHCNDQKKEFGGLVKLLPYVECSTPDGNGQTQICIDKKIEGYPTWEFADGSRLNGKVPLATLAEKTSCILPQ